MEPSYDSGDSGDHHPFSLLDVAMGWLVAVFSVAVVLTAAGALIPPY